MKGMFGCFMLYPGFIMASVFADEYTANLITNSVWPAFVLVIFFLYSQTGITGYSKGNGQ